MKYQLLIAASLLMLAAIFGVIHYELFHDAHEIFSYVVLEFVLIPIEVLVVTLIIHNLLAWHEKRHLFAKLNMVIGAFFSEAGNSLLRDFASLDPESSKIAEHLKISDQWSSEQFAQTRLRLQSHHYKVECDPQSLARIREFLLARREFLLRLLENPNLLEHQAFTDLLWAVFHLTEELSFRTDLDSAPVSDCQHLSGDVKRAYRLLVLEWLAYMKHLKNNYPYLFSLAIRTNPFDPAAKVTVAQ